MSEQNPLSKHFRQPVLHIKLPSNGKYWPTGSINLPVTGELPIYPLSAKDEIMLKSPDALLNGAGVVSAIQSCVPNISDAWSMPSIDTDAILIAMRIASFGNSLPVDATCLHCDTRQSFAINLNTVAGSIPAATSTFDEVFTVDGLRIKFKPLTYFKTNTASLIAFEQGKMASIAADESLPLDDRKKHYSHHLNTLIDLNIQTFADSTEYILTEDGIRVTQPAFLLEFYQSIPRKLVSEIREIYETLLNNSSLQPVTVTCEHEDCGKDFKIRLTFDYSNFFD